LLHTIFLGKTLNTVAYILCSEIVAG